ncbi:hypothetical protein EMCG_09288 [[Emmonsia] crescens]|uniref:Uncharacterized protein n=1 Tax=[Emmonsia] crescens TaxID=73230 RepID=A0A0G2I356_9EURO|nr:hypothetical protein EMCG_09288 [Emmonsia crescens UAMH 3008]
MIVNAQPLKNPRGAYDTTGVPKPQPPPKRRIQLPTRHVRQKMRSSMSPSCKSPNSNGDPSKHPPDSSVFLAPDDAENTRIRLSQRFNSVAATKPLAPKDVRKAFLKNEAVNRIPQAIYYKR